MEKCYVINLPSAATDEGYAKVGELLIPFRAGTPVRLVLASVSANNVSINKDSFSNVQSNSVDFSTSNTTVEYTGVEDCIIKIKNKYILTRIEIAAGDIDYFNGLFDYVGCDVPSNTRIFLVLNGYGCDLNTIKPESGNRLLSAIVTGASGSLDNIHVWPQLSCYDSPGIVGRPVNYEVPSLIDLTNTKTTLVLSDLANKNTISRLNLSGSKSVTGNIASLARLTVCSTMNFYETQVVGSLESLGEGQVGAGRTSGFIIVTCNGIITMNIEGVQTPLAAGTQKYIRFSASGYTITDS